MVKESLVVSKYSHVVYELFTKAEWSNEKATNTISQLQKVNISEGIVLDWQVTQQNHSYYFVSQCFLREVAEPSISNLLKGVITKHVNED